ncbi:MAG TPA: hypothetical protein VLK27_03600 [Chthoniobacterales bacterium]|nr:hypothetical protein [Chthoniobacterales bacterium]
MKVHLKQIPAEGLHLEGEDDCLIPGLESEGVRCAGPLQYNIDLGMADGALWANGSLHQPVQLSCVACLEKFVYVIQVPTFALHIELQGPETVDLAPFMREDILLNLPAHPRCDRQGIRVCKATKFKPTEKVQPESTAKREHDWGELDKLKPKLRG